MAYTQAQINANRKKNKLNPLIKTSGNDGFIPTKIQPKAPPQNGVANSLKTVPKDTVKTEKFTPNTNTNKTIGGKEMVSTDGGKTFNAVNPTATQTTNEIAKTDAEKVGELASSQYGEEIDLSQYGRLKYQEEQFASAETSLEESIRIQKEQKAIADAQRAESESRFLSAAKSGLAQSPEGVQTANAPLVAGYTRGVQIQRDKAELEKQTFENAIIAKRKELNEAKRSNSIALATSIENEIKELDNQAKLIDFNLAQQEAEQIRTLKNDDIALKEAEKNDAMSQISFFSTMPANAWANMDTASLNTVFEKGGFPYGTGSAVKMAKIELDEAEQIKNDEDRAIAVQTKQAQLDKLLRVDDTKAQEAVKGFQTLQNALDNGSITQKAFDSLSQEMGFAQKEMSAMDKAYKEAQTRYENARANGEENKMNQALADMDTAQGFTAMNYDVLGTLDSAVDGENGLNNNGRGQCGEFVNDVLGTPGLFQDNYMQKASKINSQIPTAGSVFISSLGSGGESGYGHVGFVKEVLDDGRIVVTDSNRYKNNEQVNTRTVDPSSEQITGYFNPVTAAKSNEINVGSLPKNQQLIAESFANGDYTRTDIDSMDFNDKQKQAIKLEGLKLKMEQKLTPEENNKFSVVLGYYPTQLVNSDKEAARIEKLVKENPDYSPEEILMSRYIDLDSTSPQQKNAINKLMSIAKTANIEPSEYLGSLQSGMPLGNIIRDVENKKIKQTNEDKNFTVSGVENRLKIINEAYSMVNNKNNKIKLNDALNALKNDKQVQEASMNRNLGAVEGRITNTLASAGFSIGEAQKLKTLLTFLNSSTRHDLAGTAVTDSEMKAIADLQFNITDNTENLVSKLATVSSQLFTNYNDVRRNSALDEFNNFDEVFNDEARVRKYEQEPNRYVQPSFSGDSAESIYNKYSGEQSTDNSEVDAIGNKYGF